MKLSVPILTRFSIEQLCWSQTGTLLLSQSTTIIIVKLRKLLYCTNIAIALAEHYIHLVDEINWFIVPIYLFINYLYKELITIISIF